MRQSASTGEGHLSEAEQARVLMWAIDFETNRHTDITSRNLMVKGSGELSGETA